MTRYHELVAGLIWASLCVAHSRGPVASVELKLLLFFRQCLT